MAKNILSYLKELFGFIHMEKPDIMVNYTIIPIMFGSLAARLSGVTPVAVFAGMNSEVSFHIKNKSGKSSLIRKVLKTILSFNKHIIFLNEEDFQGMDEAE